MSSEMWLKDDIKNILTGVHLAHNNLARHFGDPEVRAYAEGFMAALSATAASFGIPPGDVGAQDSQPVRVSLVRTIEHHQPYRP